MGDTVRLIPAGIRDERSLAYAKLIDRFGDLPTEQLLVLLIDNVDESALPHLAEEFSVTGYDGWLMATTTEAKRELLKKAFELHIYKGTRWAIREIIRIIGYTDVTFIEQPARVRRDGSHRHAGTGMYGVTSGQWALIRVIVGLADDETMTPAISELIRGGILAYKRGSSWLQRLAFRPTPPVDDLRPTEELALTVNLSSIDTALTGEPAQITIRYRTKHNGVRRYDGTTKHGATITEAL